MLEVERSNTPVSLAAWPTEVAKTSLRPKSVRRQYLEYETDKQRPKRCPANLWRAKKVTLRICETSRLQRALSISASRQHRIKSTLEERSLSHKIRVLCIK